MAWWKKLLLGLLGLAVLLVALALGFLWHSGAWNALFPSSVHETDPPDIPENIKTPAVLLFTKTNGFRHTEGIPAGAALVKTIAERRGWSVFHTENGATFNPGDLSRFDVVMFHNVTGDVFNDAQRLAFQDWLGAGGGWVGTHAAGDSSHEAWPWYIENLIGVEYDAHIMGPQFQVAEITNEAADHPAMAGLPATWLHNEEWYSWKESPRVKGFTVLASIDENSYSPVLNVPGTTKDLRMGDHPIIWSNCVGNGRTLYSTLGHAAEAYDAPEHRRLLENALAWAMDSRTCADYP